MNEVNFKEKALKTAQWKESDIFQIDGLFYMLVRVGYGKSDYVLASLSNGNRLFEATDLEDILKQLTEKRPRYVYLGNMKITIENKGTNSHE